MASNDPDMSTAVSYDDDAMTTTHPTHVGDSLTKSTTTRNWSCSTWVILPPLLPFTTTKDGFILVKAAKMALRGRRGQPGNGDNGDTARKKMPQQEIEWPGQEIELPTK